MLSQAGKRQDILVCAQEMWVTFLKGKGCQIPFGIKNRAVLFYSKNWLIGALISLKLSKEFFVDESWVIWTGYLPFKVTRSTV